MTFCDPIASETAVSTNRPSLSLPQGIPPLTSFYLYLTNGCNLACRHCWITPAFLRGEPDPGDCLDIGLLQEAVVEAKPLGLGRAKLTGGEPTLHPRFMEIVEMLTAEGLKMSMETNGTLIDAAMARHIKRKTNVSFISVSIDGARAETHDAFRGVDGAFEAALCGLDHLVEAGFRNTQVIMCPHRGNIDEAEAVVKLAEKHGATSVKFNPVTSSGRGTAMHERGEALDYDELMSLIHYVLGDLQERTTLRLITCPPPALMTLKELAGAYSRGGACGVRHILGILGTGDMALCGIGQNVPELCFGRLGEISLREVWYKHPILLRLRRDLEDVALYPGICGECVHASRCLTLCVAQNYLDSGRLVWPASSCAEADWRGEFPPTRRLR